jgi:primary-amine oxidase
MSRTLALAGNTRKTYPNVHDLSHISDHCHRNYRTGRAAVVRSRELVLQSIITVSNYEYILAFIFNQAGEVTYEIRATGILSTQPIDEGVEVPWGTVVHPGVLAVHHQHIFSLRVDPMIDGYDNRLVYDEALPMERSEFNPQGTGYYVQETIVDKSGGYDTVLTIRTNLAHGFADIVIGIRE